MWIKLVFISSKFYGFWHLRQIIFLLIESGGSFWSPTPSFHSKHKLSALLLLNSASSWCCLFDPSGGLWAMLARTLWDNWYNNRRFAHVYMQSGGLIRDRLLHHTRWYCIILFFLETGFTFTSISPPVHSAQAATPAHYAARFHSIFICFNSFQYVWIRSNPFQSVSICLNTFQSCLMVV